MNDFYMYRNSRDSSGIRKKNSPSEFWIQFPKSYILEGKWICGLIDITLDCNFKPRSSRLYLCSDIVEESYVRGSLIELLRNIEIGPRYIKTKSESYVRPIYVSVKVSTLDSIRIEIKDENLNSVDFNSNDLHCVLHFKKRVLDSLMITSSRSGFRTSRIPTNGIDTCWMLEMATGNATVRVIILSVVDGNTES